MVRPLDAQACSVLPAVQVLAGLQSHSCV
jgi:hypothetical protein